MDQIRNILRGMYHYVHDNTADMRRVFRYLDAARRRVENRYVVFDDRDVRNVIETLFPVKGKSELFSLHWTLDDFKQRLCANHRTGWDDAPREVLSETLLEMADDVNDNIAEFVHAAGRIDAARISTMLFPIEAAGALGSLKLDVANFGQFLD